MECKDMLKLWNESWTEGNWIPSWQDSLSGLSAEAAAANTQPFVHSIWQEVVHVIFWRNATLNHIARKPNFTEEFIRTEEFKEPETIDETAWSVVLTNLKNSHDSIVHAILDENCDVSRIPHHIYHDAYHLGRITLMRQAQGQEPKF